MLYFSLLCCDGSSTGARARELRCPAQPDGGTNTVEKQKRKLRKATMRAMCAKVW